MDGTGSLESSVVILRVSDWYTEIVRSSLAKGIHLFQNIGMLYMQELLFCRVGGLLETL